MDKAGTERIGIGKRPVTRGRGLRYLLVGLLMTHGQATVSEMATALTEAGHSLPGRPSKVISDALRWEVAHGRVVRVARGVYRLGRLSRSTARRVRILARRADEWFESKARDVLPAPSTPPWTDLQWLWAR